ncbi:hypothetical protein DKY63_10910 [Pseudomonas putida]|uniref:Uncharacterized protein n=2 Tax=Pseudomonas putida TaxID=303 RepID=A0A2Z4RH84_PSEPU|nr:hypothetical protein DKY63_10910 [Pseudomonas putida]
MDTRNTRLEFVKKKRSLSDQAQRTRALGGPWKREVKANLLKSPFTLRTNEMIDMFCSRGKITSPCIAKQMTGFGRMALPTPKTKVLYEKLVNSMTQKLTTGIKPANWLFLKDI